MQLQFYKYQSSGNNFILLDLFSQSINHNNLIKKLIKDPAIRKSDAILLITKSKKYDFELSFYNPDGSESFCGNGSLCSLHYLKSNNKIKDVALFTCKGQEYSAKITSGIKLKMQDITSYKCFGEDYFINTGAPHHIKFVNDVNNFDLKKEATIIRNLPFYEQLDCNVNLVSDLGNGSIYVRTFEKGVERETLSCGTGAVASVIAFSLKKKHNVKKVMTKGGELKVIFQKNRLNEFSNVYLIGNPFLEYEGKINL